MALFTMTPGKVDNLGTAATLQFLTGPPGTGKAIMLTLVGLARTHRCHDVFVVNITSIASTSLVPLQWEMFCDGVTACSRNARMAGSSRKLPSSQYRDVSVLTISSDLHEESKDYKANFVPQGIGLVLSLFDTVIHVVKILTDLSRTRWERGISDMTVAETDQVTVSYVGVMHGLERRVVVFLPRKEHEG